MVDVTPVVAASVTVLRLPVVTPTVLLSVLVAVLTVLLSGPVGLVLIWPSGFTVFWAGAEDEVGVLFAGTELVFVFFMVVAGFPAGVLGVPFFTAVGKGFLVAVAVAVGLGAALIVFFIGAVAGAAVGVDVAGTVFLFAVDDVAGVAFAGVDPAFNFLGTLLTGVAAVPEVSDEAAAGFFTGVALVIDFAAVGFAVD